jgi:uncharacterized protein
MADALPPFRYHPDPVATGSVRRSDRTCQCCGLARGFLYNGALSSEAELEGSVCPWCIADGSAHGKFGAVFTEVTAIGGQGRWPTVPREVVEEVAFRTPGFSGWQQERWFTCCDDAGAFLGPMGYKQLADLGPEAVAVIRAESGYEGAEWEEYCEALNLDFGPTAYLFRCLHCGRLGGYSDFT